MRPMPSQAPHVPELPHEAATLYPEGDGFFARRAKGRRAKLLGGIAEVLRRALAPGETVRYAARGVRYFAVEFALGGMASQHHNMVALVLTDRRLLLVQIDGRMRAKDLKHEVPLAAIRGARRSLLGGWRVALADGTKLAFLSVGRTDRTRLEKLLPASSGPKAAQPSLVHLCPACLRAVPGPVGATLACPQPDCRIPFRDPRRAARLSALVPGLGDLYLRHHLFGSLELLGSMLMLGIGGAFAVDALARPDEATLVPAAILVALTIALPRLVDWRLTLHMGRKGLVPLALAPAPGAQARNLPSFPRWSPLLFAAGVALAGGLAFGMTQDLGDDASVRAAARLAADGRFDDALARFDALGREGRLNDERRVRFALALLEAGDALGADEVRASFGEAKVDAALADRWNAALAREQAALTDYREGVQGLVRGDAAAAGRLDGALAYLRGVKRPHFPATRGEVAAHLAMGLLAEPLRPEDVEAAPRWLDALGDAPPAEAAIVRAAYHSARGARGAARDALANVDLAAQPLGFRLLALEARARIARDGGELAEVRRAAEALAGEGLDEDEADRLEALVSASR